MDSRTVTTIIGGGLLVICLCIFIYQYRKSRRLIATFEQRAEDCSALQELIAEVNESKEYTDEQKIHCVHFLMDKTSSKEKIHSIRQYLGIA